MGGMNFILGEWPSGTVGPNHKVLEIEENYEKVKCLEKGLIAFIGSHSPSLMSPKLAQSSGAL